MSAFVKPLLSIGIPFVTILFLAILFIDESLGHALIAEDGPMQIAQVVCLLAAVLYFVRTARQVDPASGERWGWWLLAALSFFVAMEEISWGQRLLGLPTPAFLAEHNAQNEISLHNLNSVQDLRHWLLVLFGAGGALAVHGAERIRRSSWLSRFAAFLPPRSFLGCFYLVLLIGLLVEAGLWMPIVGEERFSEEQLRKFGKIAELAEMYVALATFALAGLKFAERAAATRSRLAAVQARVASRVANRRRAREIETHGAFS